MIGYAMLGANDLDRAGAWHDAVLAPLGARRLMSEPGFAIWSTGGLRAAFVACTPHDRAPATVGNGVMIAFAAPDGATVDAMHAAALLLGGRCEGPPGRRPQTIPGFYAAYFRDPDGNKLNAHAILSPA